MAEHDWNIVVSAVKPQMVVVSYCQGCPHLALVNRLEGLSLPRNSAAINWPARHDRVVNWAVKLPTQTKPVWELSLVVWLTSGSSIKSQHESFLWLCDLSLDPAIYPSMRAFSGYVTYLWIQPYIPVWQLSWWCDVPLDPAINPWMRAFSGHVTYLWIQP